MGAAARAPLALERHAHCRSALSGRPDGRLVTAAGAWFTLKSSSPGCIYARSIRESAMPKAKLFPNGGSQAVRLPKEFRFEGTEVDVVREGDTVILRPARRDRSDLWERIDRRRGNEILAYPARAVLDDPTFD